MQKLDDAQGILPGLVSQVDMSLSITTLATAEFLQVDQINPVFLNFMVAARKVR